MCCQWKPALIALVTVLAWTAPAIGAELCQEAPSWSPTTTLSALGTCDVSIQCDYGSPTSVSCQDPGGDCSSGCTVENRCWVECGDDRTWCADPCATDGYCNTACFEDTDCCDPCVPESCPLQCGGGGGDSCVQGEPCFDHSDCATSGLCKQGRCSCGLM